MINKLLKRFMDLKISSKIISYYLVMLILTVSFSTFLYERINRGIMEDKVGEMSMQTIQSISSNIDLTIDTVNNQSKLLLSNENLQRVLGKPVGTVSYDDERVLNKYLTDFLSFSPLISSIYIFDNYNGRYYAEKAAFKNFDIFALKDTYWYKGLVDKKGGYIVKLNGGGLFGKQGKNYVSLIRIINSLETQNPIGVMIINISQDAFIKAYENASKTNQTVILLKDENGSNVVQTDNPNYSEVEEITNIVSDKESDAYIKNANGISYLISYLEYKYGWTITSVMPFEEISRQSDIFKLVNFVVIFINAIIIFIGSIFISRLITNPIRKLVRSMEIVKRGEFREVNITTGEDEIGRLKDVYNTMIREIQKLISRIVEEQKIKRKAELDVLQSQIKPHFLYNTFDAISSLALSDRTDEVYTLIKALGNFYRASLSNGREVITIGEEFQTLKSYATIQKIRYGDLFDIKFHIDERANKYKILKLILQPLVENALYHGIKLKGEKGNIIVKSYYEESYVKLTVEDDGIGMSEEQVRKLKNGETTGVGVRSTIERLRIFYGIENMFEVESSIGVGTKIVITLPIGKEEDAIER